MGDVSEVHRYEYPVTALQFDSRKVVACTGENGIEVRFHPALAQRSSRRCAVPKVAIFSGL